MKKFILPILGGGACLTALALGPISSAWTAGAVEVYLLIEHADKTVVETNEFLFDAKPGDKDYDKQVLGVYGIPTEKKERVIVDASKIKRPKLKPELAYLPVDKSKGENPLQAKTVEFITKLLRGGAWLTGMFFLVMFTLCRAAAPAPTARGAGAP